MPRRRPPFSAAVLPALLAVGLAACGTWLVTALNPKSITFFVAFLPQFIDPSKTSNALQSLLLGTVFVTCGFVTDGIYAFTASSLRETLLKGKALTFIQRYLAGVVFVLLGVMAASAKIS